MSSLLEQAIVDAKALREAALKNAEQAIIEKYAPDIKAAVQQILEQDELEVEDEEVIDLPPEMGEEGEAMDAEEELPAYVPPAATDGQRLCPCPEEEQEIVIDFDDLRSAVMEGEKALGISLLSEDFVSDSTEEEGAEAEEEMAEKADAQSQKDPIEEEIEEELELSEEMLDALLEKVTVDVGDISDLRSGWMEAPDADHDAARQLQLLRLQDTEKQEEFNKLNDMLKGLQENKSQTEAQNKSLKGNIKKLTETINILKEKFDEMAVINSRLLYTNRILKDVSLNERQKSKVVDALSKCDSINEAKVIYETLQSAVSGKERAAMPKSLRETINRNSSSSTIIPTRRGSQTRELSFADRMKTLAGIDKK